jgi:two-component system OmpR family response regulator
MDLPAALHFHPANLQLSAALPMKTDITGSRVLLIDDDVELSNMLRQYLETEGFRVETNFTGQDLAIPQLASLFDALVLDVMLPQINGIDLLRRIRHDSEIPVVMLTAKGDEVSRVLGLELGADDYVAKPYYPPELVARLRAVLRRRTTDPSASAIKAKFRIGDLQVDVPARRATWGEELLVLTATEFKMLVVLLQSGDTVATKDHLSLSVLGRNRESYDRSVDVHVGNLRHKLLSASQGAIEINTVRGFGYRLKQVQS